ncbi:MAG: M23 family metallopeptidase [Lysobacteraceae bacterium]|nr:MAG: M23 family metallopeptidase [Xanthomonadaceae bacterium]
MQSKQAPTQQPPAKPSRETSIGGGGAIPARRTLLPQSVAQGSLVIGGTHPAAIVEYAGRTVRVAPSGRFAFGVGRDEQGPIVVRVTQPATGMIEHRIEVTPRDWPVEKIDGVPPNTVNPPPEIAERIEREQAMVAAARKRDDAREDYAERFFIWPVQGRISGRFGNQRVYNGTPKSPHSGMDIAAAQGTAIKAPAAGIVSFAAPDLYLTGGTVVLDHGAGISSNFLHLSRIDVKVGDRVAQGQIVGAVGATGRATGPHLHWGMNWFDTRIDPLLVLERVCHVGPNAPNIEGIACPTGTATIKPEK